MGWEDPLGEEMATHSSILAGRIPRTEETGGLDYGVTESDTTEVTARAVLSCYVSRVIIYQII